MSNVTPGITLGVQQEVTRARLNLLGQPIVTPSANEIVGSMIADNTIPTSKYINNSVTVEKLGTDAQAKFGFKNYINNPQFEFWPNGTSIALAASGSAAANWRYTNTGSVTGTISRQAVTPGESDSLLRDADFWLQLATTSTNPAGISLITEIPNARLFSGQTITLSFVARVFSGSVPALSADLVQNFGTGGSPSASVTTAGTLSAQPGVAAARLTCTFTVPTVSGKTFGTNNDDRLELVIKTANSSTTYALNFTNVNLETGSAATTFENSTSRISGFDIPVDVAVNNARLTLTSATPILTGNVTAATSVFVTPYLGNRLAAWTGSFWRIIPFSEATISLSGFAANGVWSVFAVDNGGVASFETIAWTNATTPGPAAVSYQDGVLCLATDKRRRYIGSFGTTGTIGQTEFVITADSVTRNCSILIWNAQNQVDVAATINDTTDSWTYGTNAWRPLRGSNNNSVRLLSGIAGMLADARANVQGTDSGSASSRPAFGISTSTSSVSSGITGNGDEGGAWRGTATTSNGIISSTGVQDIYVLERQLGSGNFTVYGDGGAAYSSALRTGMVVNWKY